MSKARVVALALLCSNDIAGASDDNLLTKDDYWNQFGPSSATTYRHYFTALNLNNNRGLSGPVKLFRQGADKTKDS